LKVLVVVAVLLFVVIATVQTEFGYGALLEQNGESVEINLDDASTGSTAADVPIIPADVALPVNFDIQIELIRIGEINKESGEVDMDFWYTIKSDEIDFFKTPPPDVDFINGQIKRVDSEFLDTHLFEKRVLGTFTNNFNFHDFPFEKLNLDIVIEPKRPWTAQYAILNNSPVSGFDSSVYVIGSKITEFTFTTEDFSYEDEESPYSRYVGSFVIERSSVGAILKTLVPALIIVGISMSILWIPENFTPRIYLTAPLMLALVYLHMSNLNQLPPLGYLTFFDSFMLVCYAIFSVNILSLAAQMRFHTMGKPDLVIKSNNYARVLIPVIIGVSILVFYITQV